jgi:hypothetical protein
VQVVDAISKALHSKDNLPVDDYIRDGVEALEEFEVELAKRETTFFGGKFWFSTVGAYFCCLGFLTDLC